MLATKGLPAGSKLVMKIRLDFFVFKSCFLFSFRGRIWVQVGFFLFVCFLGGREERVQRLKGCLLTQIKWNFVDKQSKSISNVRLLRNDYICQLLSISRKPKFHLEFPDT